MTNADILSLIAAAIVSVLPAVCFAESAERTIEGWSSTGNEVVVRLVQRGERMVDGVSQDYYFEATEVYAARTGDLVNRYQSGTATGSPPPEYTDAKPAELAAKRRETMGLVEAHASYESPGGEFRLVVARHDEIRETGTKFRCHTRQRIGLLDRKGSRVWTIEDREHLGEVSSRRDEARCPVVDVAPAWGANGKQWAMLVRVAQDWSLKSGGINGLDTMAHAEFVSPPAMIAMLEPQGPQRDGWSALAQGDLDAAEKAFELVPTSDGAAARALVAAYRGDKGARKAADKAFRASDKTAWDIALRAATYLIAGDAKKATRAIDDAVKKANGFEPLRRIAAMFELVDVGVANQLAVHALSHPSAKEADVASTWGLLARGLVTANAFSKAAEALEKVETPDRDLLVTAARLALDKNDRFAADDLTRKLLFDNAGDCTALALRGRWNASKGENAAARQLFEAAAFCDPHLEEAVFYAADFSRLGGNLASARAGFERYLDVSLPRRSDPVREARRRAAQAWVRRLGHRGVVLAQASCQRAGEAYLCRGALTNTASEPATGVEVEIRNGKKKLAGQAIDAIAPGASRPFGLRVDTKSLDGAVIRAGRSAEEKSVNETPAR